MAGFRNRSLWMETKQKRAMEINSIVVHESKTHMEIINGNALCIWTFLVHDDEKKRDPHRGAATTHI